MITRLKLSTIEQGLPKYRSMLAGNDAYIPTSFESIATATGTGSSGTITFSSIPSTYQHLQVRWIARTSPATDSATTVRIRFNSDTGANYTRHLLYADGTSATAQGSASETSIDVRAGARTDSSGTNTMGVAVIDVHDYASTTKYKTLRGFSGADDNDTTGEISLQSGLWMNTAAISSITIFSVSGNFLSTSTFALYGIKGA